MYLLALKRRGARMNGMANPGELLINIVSLNKPKVLSRLEPKWQRSGHKGFAFPCHGQTTLPVDRESLNHSLLLKRNMVSPYFSRKGKRVARRADGSVGRGGWSKRTPSRNEKDRG